MIFVPGEKEGGCKGHEITTCVRQGEPGDKAIAYTHVYTCTCTCIHMEHALDNLLASTHAREHSHSNTASKNSTELNLLVSLCTEAWC